MSTPESNVNPHANIEVSYFGGRPALDSARHHPIGTMALGVRQGFTATDDLWK